MYFELSDWNIAALSPVTSQSLSADRPFTGPRDKNNSNSTLWNGNAAITYRTETSGLYCVPCISCGWIQYQNCTQTNACIKRLWIALITQKILLLAVHADSVNNSRSHYTFASRINKLFYTLFSSSFWMAAIIIWPIALHLYACTRLLVVACVRVCANLLV